MTAIQRHGFMQQAVPAQGQGFTEWESINILTSWQLILISWANIKASGNGINLEKTTRPLQYAEKTVNLIYEDNA